MDLVGKKVPRTRTVLRSGSNAGGFGKPSPHENTGFYSLLFTGGWKISVSHSFPGRHICPKVEDSFV